MMTARRMRQVAAAVAAATTTCMSPGAMAEVLNFDDLRGSLAWFTADYQGFRFGTNSASTTAWFYTDDINDYYGPHSGRVYVATDFALYNNLPWEATQPITRAASFKFDGAWFSGIDRVRYQLYNGSTLVYTSADSSELSRTPIFVASGYEGQVTGVVIVGHQGYYAMDDFTFNVGVPEPSSYALLAAGLVGVGAWVRRRRSH